VLSAFSHFFPPKEMINAFCDIFSRAFRKMRFLAEKVRFFPIFFG